MNGIQDGVAVVTGGGSGIGRQSSLQFAEAGASVVVADVDEDGGHETVEMIKSNGGEATFISTDVTDSEDVAAMVQTALDEYGGRLRTQQCWYRGGGFVWPTTTRHSGTG